MSSNFTVEEYIEQLENYGLYSESQLLLDFSSGPGMPSLESVEDFKDSIRERIQEHEQELKSNNFNFLLTDVYPADSYIISALSGNSIFLQFLSQIRSVPEDFFYAVFFQNASVHLDKANIIKTGAFDSSNIETIYAPKCEDFYIPVMNFTPYFSKLVVKEGCRFIGDNSEIKIFKRDVDIQYV